MSLSKKKSLDIIFIPNYILLIFVSLCVLNNSIFSLEEGISILFYILIFFLALTSNYKINLFKLHLNFKTLFLGTLILLPATIFLYYRGKVGISFRGDEIAHFSNSVTNLSYWFTPQNYTDGLTKYYSEINISLKDILNIKIINLMFIILLNLFIFYFKKKYLNISIIITSFLFIYFQNSFPYEYSQGSFFIDNIAQFILIIFDTNSISESLGITNFISFLIYLFCLRPLIIGSTLNKNDLIVYSFLIYFPYSNILLFSNYTETLGIIFVLLSIENIYKNNDLKKSIILFSIAGCFREIYFLPILVILCFQILYERKKVINNILFCTIFISPLFFHLNHISKNNLGQEKLSSVTSIENFFSIFQFTQNIISLKFILLIILFLFSLLLYFKTQNKNYLLLSFLNLPIIIILLLRHSFLFTEIDRFFYLWVIIFYIFLFYELPKISIKPVFYFLFLSLCYFNYYNFVDNYKSYKFANSTNFFIPLKNNIKTTTDLYFYSDMSVNKFTKNIYKNLNSVNFLSNKDLCDCSANNSYFFVTEKKINEKEICKFSDIHNCKFKTNFYNLYDIRFN